VTNGVNNEIVLRLNVEQIDPTPLRDAYTKMQALSPTDNRGWIYWAEYHGFSHYYCWHHGRTGANDNQYPYNLFLPWHRAYLVYWENVAREQNSKATLSWWDWTSQTGVPTAFAQPRTNGNPNPLFSGPTPDMPGDPARQTRRWPGDPGELPSPQDIQTILNLVNFEDFQNQLEDIHDFVHGWTGGINPDNPRQGGDMGAWAQTVVATGNYSSRF
jgi:tyrosinase